MRRLSLCATAVGLVFATAAASHAQTAGTSPSATTRYCDTPEYRRLDFRIGSFTAATASGTHAGSSRVNWILDGCAQWEDWQAAVSGAGRDLIFYATDEKRWHFVFVNRMGRSLRLTGRFKADALVFEGKQRSWDGRDGLHRYTFAPDTNGGVRHLWEFSVDGGRHWEVLVDLRLTRNVETTP